MALSQLTEPPMSISKRTKADLNALIRDVAKGDRLALAELYRQMEKSIFAFAKSRLGDAETASDVLQDVMLTVWQKASAFRGGSQPRTWILGITHHKILDVLRRQKRFTDAPDEEAIDIAPTPYDNADHGERRAAVRQALGTLGDHHRQVVHLAFFEDLPYPEIARILEIPEGTVKSRMLHAKKILARRLRPLREGDLS